MTPMKLQKILYFVAAEYAKRTEQPLLAERFQTWTFGPVSYSVYDEFRPFSKRNINRYARDAQGQALIVDEDEDPDLRDSLDSVWEATKRRTAVDLSQITHMRDSAWWKAYQEDRDVLDQEDILKDDTYRCELAL